MKRAGEEVLDRMEETRNMLDLEMGVVVLVGRSEADPGELEKAFGFGKDLGHLAGTGRFQR